MLDGGSGFTDTVSNGVVKQSGNVRWIWVNDPVPSQNRYVAFRLVVTLADATATACRLQLSAVNQYALYVNGRYQGRGPGRAWQGSVGLDTCEIGGRLHPGRNTISLLVNNLGVPSGGHPETIPGFRLEGDIGGCCLSTGVAPWESCVLRSWNSASPRISLYQGFNEDVDLNIQAPELWERGAGGTDWMPAPIRNDPAHAQLALIPRMIPPLSEQEVNVPMRVLAAGVYDLPSDCGEWWPARHQQPMPPDRLRILGTPWPVEIGAGKSAYLILDLGRMLSGVIELEVQASGHSVVRLGYADRLYEQGRVMTPAAARLSSNPCDNLNVTLVPNYGQTAQNGGGWSVDRLRLRPGWNRWRGTFNVRGFRYLQLDMDGLSGALMIRRVVAHEITYPVSDVSVFRCADPTLNALWEASRLTARLCMADTYMDNPSRERQQYGGDGRVQALYGYSYFGDTRLARQFLYQFAGGIRPDGAMQSGGPWPWNQIIPAWTLHWIEALREYTDYTGDETALKDLAGTVARALVWFEPFIGTDGTLTIPEVFGWASGGTPDKPAETLWNFIDWQGVDGQLKGEPARLSLNAIYHQALNTGAWIQDKAGQVVLAAALRARQDRMTMALHTVFQQGAPGIGQEHVLVFATLAGLIRGRMGLVAERILNGRIESDLLSMWFTLKALEQERHGEAVVRAIRDVLGPIVATGFQTLFETRRALEHPSHAVCQGASAFSGYFLPRIVTGILPSSRKDRTIVLDPHPGIIEWAEAALPVADGIINVSMKKDGRRILMTCRLPAGWRAIAASSDVVLCS